MSRFIPGIAHTEEVQVERRNVFWIVDFDLPEAVSESLPLSETRNIKGRILMGFYCDPVPGDVITYRGHHWKVAGREFNPARYKSKDKRYVPVLLVEYIGQRNGE